MISYKIIKIPKSHKRYRTIYVPSTADKEKLRNLLPLLEMILADIDKTDISYAFQKNKNCAQAASQHIGYSYTLSLDLKDFFCSVTTKHLEEFVPNYILDQCLIDGAPQQGLPTSPILANIAFAKCDNEILYALNQLDVDICYTRYADDLTFSFNERRLAGRIKVMIFKIVSQHGFTINSFKTRLQRISNGRIIIHGIGVDHHGLHPTRKIKKKMRAAKHQENINSYNGLSEWSKCKI